MEIREQRQGAVMVLRPVGPLVQADVRDLERRITESMSRTLGRVVIDASAVPFVDSAGLEMLAEAADEMRRGGRSLRLCGVTETVREILDLTELTGLFEFYEDAGDAARSFL